MSKRKNSKVQDEVVGTIVETSKVDVGTITIGSGSPSTIVREDVREGMVGVTIQGSPKDEFVAPKTRTTKTAQPSDTGEATKTSQRYDWEGMAVTKVLRWLGSKGITAKPASEALRKLGIEGVAMATVQTQVQLGRKDKKVPVLTDEQASKLLAVCV